MTNRRDFIRNSSLLSIGVSFGVLPNFAPKTAFESQDLKKNWLHFAKTLGAQSLPILEDAALFTSEKHAVEQGIFKNAWGAPVYFKNANVVARPLWRYKDNASTPHDVSVLFWEKKGTWHYVSSYNGLQIKALAQLADENTEGVLLPRLGDRSKLKSMEHLTAQGKLQVQILQSKEGIVSHVKIWQKEICTTNRKISILPFNNLI